MSVPQSKDFPGARESASPPALNKDQHSRGFRPKNTRIISLHNAPCQSPPPKLASCGGSSQSHPRATAMSVYRVGVSRYTETHESGYRVGACRSTDPDSVGRPTPSESVARHSEASIPTVPRGSGHCPNGLASVQVSTRQNARLHSALCKVALVEVQVCTTANANLRRCGSSRALRQLQTCTSHSPRGWHKRRFCVT